jgi:hypothetical protein
LVEIRSHKPTAAGSNPALALDFNS